MPSQADLERLIQRPNNDRNLVAVIGNELVVVTRWFPTGRMIGMTAGGSVALTIYNMKDDCVVMGIVGPSRLGEYLALHSDDKAKLENDARAMLRDAVVQSKGRTSDRQG
jgi:hypothetical protein